MRRLTGTLFLCVVLAVAGCSNLTHYTTSTPYELNLPADALLQVQYYLADPLTLEFLETRSTSFIIEGNRVRNDRERYEKNVYLPTKTPMVAETITEGMIQVRVARDLTLTFRPDSVLGFSLDSTLTALDSLAILIEAGDLPPEADTLLVYPPDSILQDVPFHLTEINDTPVYRDSTIFFRDSEFTVRYGRYTRGRQFISGPAPRLQFVRKLNKIRTRDVEVIQGAIVPSMTQGGDS